MKKIGEISLQVYIFLIVFLIFSANWASQTFANVTMDEIVYHLMVSIEGTDMDTVYSFIKSVIPGTIILSLIIIFFLFYKSKKHKVLINLRIKKTKKTFQIFPLRLKVIYKYVIVIILSFSIFNFFLSKLDFYKYVEGHFQKSEFIEKHYVEPKDVKLKFPKEKPNLIYLFLESMENSYKSIAEGGIFNYNLIPELTDLENKYISLAPKLKSVYGTGYTMGGLVSQTSGIPIKITVDQNSWEPNKKILPGVTSIGNILKDEGYNQMIMFGSDSNFASRRAFFTEQGYKVWDLNVAINEGRMSEEDKVFWGFDDSDLFGYAKEQIKLLSKENKPFNFSLLTANTHFEDGWLESHCDTNYDDQYSAVIACSSKQINDFVNWIKQQAFYENTVIIIVGDHLTMSTKFNDKVPKDYDRGIYNTIINSKIDQNQKENRKATVLDMFPTTLASMGVEIEGNRLGLGVNLFSNEKTLLEKYDFEYISEELNKRSAFYNNKFILNQK